MSTAPMPLGPSTMAAFLSNDPAEEIPPVDPINNHSDPMATLSSSSYSVPAEAERVLKTGIIANPLIAKDLPLDVEKYAKLIKFVGNDKPNIPINWRFAESISALKALESIWINNLLAEKYKEEPKAVVIDTNHASLFFMSVFLWTIDPKGSTPIGSQGFSIGADTKSRFDELFKSKDVINRIPLEGNPTEVMYKSLATNIYRTADDRMFHCHGSLDPEPVMKALRVPESVPEGSSLEECWKPYKEAVAKLQSQDIQKLMSDEYRQAGTICYSTDDFKETEHYKANSHVGLYEIHSVERSKERHPASWWPSTPQTSPSRPLAGLKVLDVTRIIAAPAITRGLAEYGASVMRVMSKHLPDSTQLHVDLHWGKWTTNLDFRKPEDLEAVKKLILDADIVVSGYRPGVMEKYGLGPDDIFRMIKESGRERGIIVARENCYGWNGPWSYRSGWQQISDAVTGVSAEYSNAMGNPAGEAVTPVFPNSDYCTGVAGLAGILDAISRRGKEGGSYKVDVALNYYSQWLVNSVGTYPKDVWEELWERNGKPSFRHYHNMGYTIPALMKALYANDADTGLFRDEYFKEVENKAIRQSMRIVKPVVQWQGEGRPKQGFNVGTRGNAFDAPRWPKDLLTEIVGAEDEECVVGGLKRKAEALKDVVVGA